MKKQEKTAQTIAALVLSIALAVLTACQATTQVPTAAPTQVQAAAPTSAPLTKVIFGLDWAVVGQHAPFFVALDKGFWKEEGLDVEIVTGNGSADAVQKVATGSTDIGFGDTSALVVARTEGVDVKLIGMLIGQTPASVIYPMDKPIEKPADLEGKKIGAAAGDAVRRVFPAFADVAGFDINKVEFVTIGYEVYAAELLSGRIDGLAEYYAAKPNYDKAAAESNLELGILRFADNGLDIYSNGFLAKESYVAEHPEVIQGFLRGVFRGYAYAYEHEDEAVEILLKHEPTLDRDVVRQQFLLDKEAILIPDVLENGYGHIDAAKMERTIDVTRDAYELTTVPTVEEMYTNEFLPSKEDVLPAK